MRITDPETGRSYFDKRRRRYDEPGQPRELTFSCYRRYQFLSTDRTREWFCAALDQTRSKIGIQLWAYVIMPEHVHILINPQTTDGQVSEFLKGIKEPLARRAVAHLKKHAPSWLDRIAVREGQRLRHRFWQPGGGYDRNVVEIGRLRSMIDYIHANPVRRGLVQRPEDWEWSSARWFAGLTPIRIAMDREVLEALRLS